MNYSIIYLGSSEDKRVFHYTLNCDYQKTLKMVVYNQFLDFIEYEETINMHPGSIHWTSLPMSNKERYVEFIDPITKIVIARFGLEGISKMKDYNIGNYAEKIKPYLTHSEKYCLSATFNEIFIYKVYDNDFVFIEKNDLVIDIGFNFGSFSLFSLYKEPKKIIAFEPNKRLVDLFKSNFNDERIELQNFAVSNYDGTATFFKNENPGLSFISNSDENKNESENDVTVINFFDYLMRNKINYIDYLKVDCEGCEFDVIKSLPDAFLGKSINKIVVEFHDFLTSHNVQTIVNRLVNLGFDIKIENKIDKPIGVIYAKKLK